VKIKAGVSLEHLTPQMALAADVVAAAYALLGYNAVITSGSDGDHKGQPVAGDTVDPHYAGKALDFRTSNVAPADLSHLVVLVKDALGEGFVVLLENDHIHVQWGHIA